MSEPQDLNALQLTPQGQLRHFISIEGLSRELLNQILSYTDSFLGVGQRNVKKVPLLRGKTVMNIFFEPSTRTRTTFELAAKRLSADVLNINVADSSTKKGETLIDMLQNLEAMGTDMFVVRHNQNGTAQFIAQQVSPHVSIINAGDGTNAHPTQAMLDMYTILKHKGPIDQLRIAIVGDILHSRVAHSDIQALLLLGAKEIRLIAPPTLLPTDSKFSGVSIEHDLKQGLADIDVVMTLRLQKERMISTLIPSEEDYYQRYGLRPETLRYAKPDAIVMHPGPINRGVEIAAEVADGPQSVILKQVTYGIAVRMAIMAMIAAAQT